MATPTPTRYKLLFHTPPTHLPLLKTALFATGAGAIGAYTQCCFTTPGVGQFKPGPDAKPAIGGTTDPQGDGVVEVGEVRCEMVCTGREGVVNAVEALKSNHPYEEPAYEVYKMEDF